MTIQSKTFKSDSSSDAHGARSAEEASALAWAVLRNQPIPCAPRYLASMWVKLFNPPTAFSFDEAWLLCQAAEDQWLAWIPDYGEILLNSSEFCSLTED
jgi:hypothetical protein